jgi:hypothetical protein
MTPVSFENRQHKVTSVWIRTIFFRIRIRYQLMTSFLFFFKNRQRKVTRVGFVRICLESGFGTNNNHPRLKYKRLPKKFFFTVI